MVGTGYLSESFADPPISKIICCRCVLTAWAAGEVLFADVLLLPNGMSKVGPTNDAGFWFIPFVGFLWDVVIDGAGLAVRGCCRDAGMFARLNELRIQWANYRQDCGICNEGSSSDCC